METDRQTHTHTHRERERERERERSRKKNERKKIGGKREKKNSIPLMYNLTCIGDA